LGDQIQTSLLVAGVVVVLVVLVVLAVAVAVVGGGGSGFDLGDALMHCHFFQTRGRSWSKRVLASANWILDVSGWRPRSSFRMIPAGNSALKRRLLTMNRGIRDPSISKSKLGDTYKILQESSNSEHQSLQPAPRKAATAWYS
jgi:hypothetical protein